MKTFALCLLLVIGCLPNNFGPKSVEKLAPVHSKQLLTYLRLTNLQVGLLINFGSATLKEGLHRIVNKLSTSGSTALRVNRNNLEVKE